MSHSHISLPFHRSSYPYTVLRKSSSYPPKNISSPHSITYKTPHTQKKNNHTYPPINLKHRFRHDRLHHFLHLEPSLPRQIEKRQILMQQPGPMRAEEDQSSRGGGTPERGLDGLKELGVLGVVEDQVGENQNVKAC